MDAARLDEQYVIRPGAEPLFSEMLGSGETLPGECTLGDGRIARTSVLATYTCGGGQIVLQLLHPESAAPDGVRTQRFAITVKTGAPPPGLVDAVAERIRAREAAFEWTDLGPRGARPARWVARLVAGTGVAMLVLWAVRRLRARRRRPA